MGTLRFADLQTRPTEVRDWTSLTGDELRPLVPPFGGRVPGPYGPLAPRWEATPRAPVHHRPELSAADPRGSAALSSGLSEDLPPPSGAGAALRDGSKQSPSVDSPPLRRPAGDTARAGGCPGPVLDRVGRAPRDGRGRRGGPGCADGGTTDSGRSARARTGARLPPFGHDGTARRLERPQDPTEQTRGDRGKKKYQTVKTVLLINAALTSLWLSDTYAGSTHDQRIADATPDPLPAGSRLLQDLGCLACTRERVAISMPTRKPRGRSLTRTQKAANRRLARRRVRSEHVNSSVKRCRIVHDTCRLRKAGVRDLLMEICCALHNFRVRLTPWQPMV
jgi:hypothetical protein